MRTAPRLDTSAPGPPARHRHPARRVLRSGWALAVEVAGWSLAPLLALVALVTPYLASSNCFTLRCEQEVAARINGYWFAAAASATIAAILCVGRHHAGARAKDSALMVIAGSIVGWVALFSIPFASGPGPVVVALALGIGAGWAVHHLRP